MTTKDIWDEWERIALDYLKRHWYTFVAKNFRFSIFWEVDIICEKNDETVFVEVKYRYNDKFWAPEDYITSSKKWKLLKTIQYYISKNNISDESIRFDIICINKKLWKLIHYKRQSLE